MLPHQRQTRRAHHRPGARGSFGPGRAQLSGLTEKTLLEFGRIIAVDVGPQGFQGNLTPYHRVMGLVDRSHRPLSEHSLYDITSDMITCIHDDDSTRYVAFCLGWATDRRLEARCHNGSLVLQWEGAPWSSWPSLFLLAMIV